MLNALYNNQHTRNFLFKSDELHEIELQMEGRSISGKVLYVNEANIWTCKQPTETWVST